MPTLTVTTNTDYSSTVLSNIDTIQFQSVVGPTLVATFSRAQFNNIQILGSVLIRGGIGKDRLDVAQGDIDASLWTFADWSNPPSGVGDLVTLTGGAFANTMIGSIKMDIFDGGNGNDTLDGKAGDDTFLSSSATDGADSINGGTGTDSMIYTGSYAISVTLNAGVYVPLTTSGGDTDMIANIENIFSGSGADSIIGDATNSIANLFSSGDGNDTLDGAYGNDTLIGGAGADSLIGGGGDDVVIVGSNGDALGDVIDGGFGLDEIRFIQTASAETYALLASTIGIERIVIGTGTEFFAVTSGTTSNGINAIAGANALELVGNDGANAITGSSFADSIRGNGGADDLNGSNGNDAIFGNAGADSLDGDTGSDTLFGNAGADSILGGADDDALLGYSALAVPTMRVSTTSAGGEANGASTDVRFSPDGTRIVFSSSASNLVAGDTNGHSDIFIKDLVTGAITRISTNGSGQQATGGGSSQPVFSPDGMSVAFASRATNLVSGDTNGLQDIFVKLLDGGGVNRISVTSGLSQALGGDSFSPEFSPDGIYVAFDSDATNLVLADTNGVADVFRVQLNGTFVQRLSFSSSTGEAAGGGSFKPVYSPDGTRIAFYSAATNLVAGDTNGFEDVFVYDLSASVAPFTRISTDSSGNQADHFSVNPVFSPDGTRILFQSRATNLVAGDTNARVDIFIKDLVTGAITRVSTDSAGGEANGDSVNATFSPDGLSIAFESTANNLVAGDTNGQPDIFIKNLVTGVVSRVSLGATNAQVNGSSIGADFSPDGTMLAFQSAATDIVSGDTNGAQDIIVRTIDLDANPDTLDGGSGNDTMVGGAGNDVYFVDSTGDAISEVAGDAADEVRTTLTTFTLGTTGRSANVEILRFIGSGAFTGIGDGAANALVGGTGNDSLTGDLGDDTLIGALGNDTLVGNSGNDVYVVDVTGDVITEAAGDTADEVQTTLATFTLGVTAGSANVENLRVIGSNDFSGFGDGAANSMVGNAGDDTLGGGAGNDTMVGDSGYDLLIGGTAINAGGVATVITRPANLNNDSIVNAMLINSGFSVAANGDVAGSTILPHVAVQATANAGQFITHFYKVNVTAGQSLFFDIDAASGFDTDTVLRLFNPNGVLVNADDDTTGSVGAGGGTGLTTSYLSHSALLTGAYTIEVARLLSLTGKLLDNTLTTQALDNGASGMTYTLNISVADQAASSGADSLIGGVAFDTLLGGDGADTLEGGTYADIVHGGAGDDVIIVAAAADFDPDDQMDGGLGFDELRIGQVSFGASANNSYISSIEALRFTGGPASFLETYFGPDRISTTVTLEGGTAAQTPMTITMAALTSFSAAGFNYGTSYIGGALAIVGDSSDEAITGSSRADSLIGNGGVDTLDGGTGADTLNGGDGADFFLVDNTLDVVIEGNGINSGYDIVTASANYTLSDNVEQLVIQGGATQGTGGDTANYLYGGNSGLSLRLDGGGGDDVIYAGLAGGNTLIGGSGVDTLLIYGGDIAANNANGGIGADIYYTYSVNDVLSEVGGDGIDTVYSSHNITLAAGFEQLLLFGLAISATGSADNNIMYGNSTTGPVSLSGLNGSDVLVGGTFNDTLDGGIGVDLLFGYGGTNTLIGGDDTDIYYLETSGNIITETTTGGFDTIYSNVIGVTTLAANVEQLILYGNATGGIGTGGNDYIYANAATSAAGVTLDGAGGSDYLLGSAFADTLIGGAGNDQIDLGSGGIDRIRYNAAGHMGADTVYNFDAAANDLIDLTGRGYVAGNIGSAITLATFGGGTLVTFASGNLAGTTINLVGAAVGSVTALDFVF